MQFAIILGIVLATTIGGASAWADESRVRAGLDGLNERLFCTQVLGGDLFARTELYFGRNRPGGVVSEQEFQDFLDRQVTPLFPDGLTVVDAKGQFRAAGQTVPEKEDSKVLILFYPFERKASRSVDEIRAAYKQRFEQQSVLRVDERSCVSF